MSKNMQKRRPQNMGAGVGLGHGGNSKLPNIKEIPPEDYPAFIHEWKVGGQIHPETRFYRMGRCFIWVSPPSSFTGWHLSISCPDRYPSWDEIAKAWYDIVGDVEGSMILPKKREYINVHNFCFQVHEVR